MNWSKIVPARQTALLLHSITSMRSARNSPLPASDQKIYVLDDGTISAGGVIAASPSSALRLISPPDENLIEYQVFFLCHKLKRFSGAATRLAEEAASASLLPRTLRPSRLYASEFQPVLYSPTIAAQSRRSTRPPLRTRSRSKPGCHG